jgi:hypothetical protein
MVWNAVFQDLPAMGSCLETTGRHGGNFRFARPRDRRSHFLFQDRGLLIEGQVGLVGEFKFARVCDRRSHLLRSFLSPVGDKKENRSMFKRLMLA